MDVEETQLHHCPSDTDLDFSFNSTATDRTFASSSARSSLARSSLTLSFNDRLSTTSTTTTTTTIKNSLHHRKCDPHWSAIKTATNLSTDGKLHLRHLKLLRHLGTGNLGRVFLCQLRDCNNANFALKVIDKDSLTNKKLSHVQMEGEILSMLDHPFLPTLYAHLEVSHYTCLLIDYCPNGDLHSLLRKQPGNRLPVQAVKFFAAEVLVALEYLHAADVVPTFDRRVHKKIMAGSTRRGGGCFGTVNRRGWPLIRNYKPPEVRGLVAKKGRSHPSGHLLGSVSSPRRKCWWRLWKKGGSGLANLLRSKGSSPRYYPLSNSQHYNGNYHHYKFRKSA
ncbi:hypothetical protein D5086_022498 [Populus alba]|uniref:Uncharacterized protein n=1 Tax=Populus alba TaxID=43335 RepID=A0ACC4BFA5_POPAL